MAFDITPRPEFDHLRESVDVILSEMNRWPTWFDWGSDAFSYGGRCLFLSGAHWKVSPLYFGDRQPSSMVQSRDHSATEIDRLCRQLPEMYPETTKLLRQIKSINYAAFSKLLPQSRLEEHYHKNPGSMIMHMGLIIPPVAMAGLAVDGRRGDWLEPGQMYFFDDNLPHAAWNDSLQERVVLYVDFNKETTSDGTS